MSDKRKRIVIKFGTGILTKSSGNALNPRQLRRLTSEVAEVVQAGHQCLLVSSGAVGAGLMLMGLAERPKDLPSIQACAAIGQSRLMRLYETLFQRHGLHVAQLLLSHQDIDSRTRYQNARNTLERLLRFGNVVPIINENDSVAVEELRFGDNDRLSAEVAILAQADLLLILTSVEGLLDEQKKLISKVTDIDAVVHLASERDRDLLNGRNGDEAAGGKDGFSSRDSQRDRKRVRARSHFRCSGWKTGRHPNTGK